MKKRNKNEPMKATFHVSFQRTQVGGKEATRLKQEKKRQTNLQIKPSEKELSWVQIMLKRTVTETITNSILNKSKNQQNYVSFNQMCTPKPQIAKEENNRHRK